MGSLSWIHWAILIAVFAGLAGFFIPAALVMKRAGWSPWLALLLLVPGAAIVLLWVFALAPWPALDRAKAAENA